MVAYFRYDNATYGTDTTVDGGGHDYNFAPPAGSSWSWDGTVTGFALEEQDDSATMFNGDDEVNEQISSQYQFNTTGTQTIDSDDGNSISYEGVQTIYDFSFQVTDGTSTWEVAVIDVDLNNDNDVQDADEDGYFLVFPDGQPPAGTDLTVVDQGGGESILDNSNSRSHADLGGVKSSTEMLYLGNYTVTDTDDSNFTIENAEDLLGVYLGENISVVPVIENNTDNSTNIDPLIRTDDAGGTPETFTYDVGGGNVTVGLESTAQYNSLVTYADGSEYTVAFSLNQMQNGDTFINVGSLPSGTITSVELTSVLSDGYSGVYTRYTSFENITLACFTSGTLIKTIRGGVPVEELSLEDKVLTLDAGYQKVEWIGSRSVSGSDLTRSPKLRPIRIRTGALGVNQPEQDLLVSPQHRVLLRSKIAQRMFGADEVLAAAKQLLELDGVEIAEDVEAVSYWHFMFETHQLVFSNGAATESMYAGSEALKAVSPEAREEILTLFPELRDHDVTPIPARRLLKGREVRNLVARHVKNNKSLTCR